MQRELLQRDNGSHGDRCPAVQSEEVQHWPRPPQLFEFSPGRSRCLLRSKGTLSCRNDDQWRGWMCVRACICVSINLGLPPVLCIAGLYPKPCIPDLWVIPEPMPGGHKKEVTLLFTMSHQVQSDYFKWVSMFLLLLTHRCGNQVSWGNVTSDWKRVCEK